MQQESSDVGTPLHREHGHVASICAMANLMCPFIYATRNEIAEQFPILGRASSHSVTRYLCSLGIHALRVSDSGFGLSRQGLQVTTVAKEIAVHAAHYLHIASDCVACALRDQCKYVRIGSANTFSGSIDVIDESFMSTVTGKERHVFEIRLFHDPSIESIGVFVKDAYMIRLAPVPVTWPVGATVELLPFFHRGVIEGPSAVHAPPFDLNEYWEAVHCWTKLREADDRLAIRLHNEMICTYPRDCVLASPPGILLSSRKLSRREEHMKSARAVLSMACGSIPFMSNTCIFPVNCVNTTEDRTGTQSFNETLFQNARTYWHGN